MKKLVLVLVALLVLASPLVVSGATGVTYTTGFRLQNLNASAPAAVVINFYDQNGVEPTGSSINTNIPANGSVTYFPLGTVNPGFNGSVVVSSDQPVAGIVNVLGNNSQRADSYAALGTGATNVSLPLVFKARYGFDTWFNVQNTGTADATVNVAYAGTSCTEQKTVKPNASQTFDQATNSCLPTNFAGAATVTSNQPVAVVLLQVGTNALMAYNGFIATTTTPVMPLLQANNYGNFTGIQVMNTGGSSTDVTVSFSPASAGTACTETHPVAAGQSVTFGYPMPATCGSKFIGSGKVTVNSASQPLAAIVNQVNTGNGNASSYNALNPAEALQNVSLPIIMDRNFGWYTGISVVNMGTAATDISCTFSGSTHTASATGVAPGAALIDVQLNAMNSTGSYVGAATCSASAGGKIAAIVNQANSGSATNDVLMTYPGIGY